MGKYHVELSGKLTLGKQSKAIEGEEAFGAKFLNARIWVNDKNLLTNLVEFEEVDEVPPPPTLQKTLPTGATPVWTGPMIVQGSAVPQVFLTRSA
jgi:hypothetical protein